MGPRGGQGTGWRGIRSRGAKHIWLNHEQDLREGGSVFFTWQYDMRWAAQRLRNDGILMATGRGAASRWRLTS